MRKDRAFTLIEMIVVIAIIGILAAITLPAVRHARNRARRASAESMISSLQTALSMYNMDYGVYPASVRTGGTTTQRNANSFHGDFDGYPNNLVAALRSPAVGGPYMEFRGGDLHEDETNDLSNRYVLRDPWGHAYVYTARVASDGNLVDETRAPFHPYTDEPEHNTYNIYSLGQDGRTDGFAGFAEGTTWHHDNLVNNEDAGHWRAAASSDDPNYDDINSWDGAR